MPPGNGSVFPGWGTIADPKQACKLAGDDKGLTITVPPVYFEKIEIKELPAGPGPDASAG